MLASRTPSHKNTYFSISITLRVQKNTLARAHKPSKKRVCGRDVHIFFFLQVYIFHVLIAVFVPLVASRIHQSPYPVHTFWIFFSRAHCAPPKPFTRPSSPSQLTKRQQKASPFLFFKPKTDNNNNNNGKKSENSKLNIQNSHFKSQDPKFETKKKNIEKMRKKNTVFFSHTRSAPETHRKPATTVPA